MPSLRDIRKKIGGVSSTQQITRAMKMVATAKLRRSVEQLNATKYYLEKLEDVVSDLRAAADPGASGHPLCRARPVRNAGIVLVTGERGLCGSFNQDLFRFCNARLTGLAPRTCHLILLGRKGHDYYRRRNIPILAQHPGLSGPTCGERVRAAARDAVKLFENGVIDELFLIYTNFISALSREIVMKRLIPLEEDVRLEARTARVPREIIFDPSPDELLGALIPRYVEGLFMRAVLESSASEQSARMMAMGAATDRADEILDKLSLVFNRTRQAKITTELNEVVAGAQGLSG